MFQLDYSDHRPLWEQIRDKMKELIISGALGENDKVPSVRELAAILAINPNTIQKAYKELENQGYIYSRRAKGSFVVPQEAAANKIKTEELYKKLESALQELFFCGEGYGKIIEKVNSIYKSE